MYIKEPKNIEVKNELYDRMNFCGFNKEMIECFVDLEKFIINYQNLVYDNPLYNKYYWFKTKNKIFEDINNIFMINTDKVTKTTITFSECICLLDEATYIMELYQNKYVELFDEIKVFAETNSDSFIRKEITYRFMLCYDKIKKDNEEMPDDYFYKINKFINNELRIINLCKWIYPNDRQNGIIKQWKPYTREYYDYYN
jgi:hypothetical protein